jgi:RNA polymerase sigma-70 factor (family 1)
LPFNILVLTNIAKQICNLINNFFVLELITALKNDDKVAFEKVYYTYYEKLYGFYKTKTGSEFISEELAQEAFIKLWVYRKTLSVDFTVEVQLFRIAKTIFIDTIKKRKLEIVYMDEIGNYDVWDSSNGNLDAKEFAKQVQNHIESMPPIMQKVFKLSRIEGLSHHEIAKTLSISPKSVNNHITKAIKRLKELIVITASIIIYFLYLK